MKHVLYFIFVVLLFSCSNSGKQQRLATEEIIDQETMDHITLSGEVVLDTIIRRPDVKYKEKRFKNSQSPAVKLDFTRTDVPEKELDLADYYSSVEYVTLKFPFPDKGGFLGEFEIKIISPHSSSSMRPYGSEIHLLGDKIIAGDWFQGYYYYDKEGTYLRPLVLPDNWHDFRVASNNLTIEHDRRNKYFGVSSLGENYLLHVIENKEGTMFFGNTVKDKIYMQRPYYYSIGPLSSPSSYLTFYYHPERSHPIMAQNFSLEDEILCNFSNHNPELKKKEGIGYYPQPWVNYDYNGVLTFRQQYNDTIFRLRSNHELEVAYILNFGDKRQGVQDGYIGGHEGKYAPDILLETNDFIWIQFIEGRDTPSARESGSVKFFYYFYDKKEKQLYKQPSSDFPEMVLMKNSLQNGLPMRGYFAKSNGKTLYEGFTKNQLQLLIKHPVFTLFTKEQQQLMKDQYEGLNERDLLIIILNSKQ